MADKELPGKQMAELVGHVCHKCAPKEWHDIRDITGSYEMDGMISRTGNVDMHHRLENHLTGDQAYRRNTSYNRSSGG